MSEEGNNLQPPAEPAAAEPEAPAKSEPTLSDLSLAISAQAQILQDLIQDNRKAKEQQQAAAAAAEAAQAEKLPEVDKMRREREMMEMERKAWEVQRGEFAQAELQRAKNSALDKIGVLPQYRQIVPDSIDPRTTEGSAQLEKFFSDKPAMLTQRGVPERKEETPEALGMSQSLFRKDGRSTNGLTSIKAMMANRRKMGLD